MEKKLFISDSFFSIFSILNIINYDKSIKKNSCNIIIIKKIDYLSEIYQILKKHKKINSVKVINKSSLFFNLKILFEKKKKKRNIYNTQYKEIFSKNIINSIFLCYFNNCKINLIDDGLITYTGYSVEYKHRNFFLKIFNLIFNQKLIPKIKNVYLYEPRLFLGSKKIKLKKITKPKKNFFNRIIFRQKIFFFNRLFVGSNPKLLFNMTNIHLHNKYNIITNIFFTFLFIREFKKIHLKILSIVKNSFFYKNHPSEKINYINNFNQNKKFVMPLEIFFSKKNNIKIILNYFSSASILPFIIYKKKIKTIFLNKLFDYNFYKSNEIISKLRKLYGANFFYTPRNINQLKKLLM